ncbi:acetylornithine deacetylase [Marivivens donghaensis]|uniref:Acetylornithine deacetylase n=1 Tax=Marivivens donghaensis TaxID=1699413 RepID=A0ABX0VU16_9RHOB|nr:acetylornithine deacetylase [Marivivens donghaensis]NIY71254.1 acetylornithine deacetylase [Marivivens donghaensis]
MDTIALLEKLIAFETVSAKSNLPLIDFVDEFLRSRGWTVDRIEDGEKAGLFCTLGPIASGGIILSAHSDVVPTDGQNWTKEAFQATRQDGRIYGRGATDMKGFLAAMLALAGRVKAEYLQAPLMLSISYDEEVGCVGMQNMIAHLPDHFKSAALCIVGEPTEMKVAIGHKGKSAMKAVCTGQAGHSSLAPKFVNAVQVAAAFARELDVLQTRMADRGAHDEAYDIPYSTFHVGSITGGSALNIVPDRAEVLFEFRHLAADKPEDLLSSIDAAAAKALAGFKNGAGIEIEVFNSYPGFDAAPESVGVQRAFALAENANPVKVAFGTEAGFFAQLGIPTVVCGPGSMSAQGHKPDEYIEESQLAACDDMLGRVLEALQLS